MLAEPPQPAFLVDLHLRLDAAVARNDATVVASHSYSGWEVGHEAVSGWRTKIVRRANPGRTMEVWFDALDEDVCLLGDVEYQELTWGPGEEILARACLDELDRLVDEFATD